MKFIIESNFNLQSRCSASDLLRMEAILASKLECSSSQQGMPVTPLSFLRVMSAVSRAAAARLEVLFPPIFLHMLLLITMILLIPMLTLISR